MSTTSLNVAVAHAVSFLTRPLIVSYPATTIIKLQLILEANLTALYAPTWVVQDPLSGSGRRCLTLSPECLPPRAIYGACLASGVQWFDWIALLSKVEFDFFVDPGCVSLRQGKRGTAGSQLVTIWADEIPSPAVTRAHFDDSSIQAAIRRRADVHEKTFAQQLIEQDLEEDAQIFSMIANEVHAPTWSTPVPSKFQGSLRSTSPLSTISSSSTISSHSRCSSRSSNSNSSYTGHPADSSSAQRGKKLSRRERARQARVFVDTSKTEVTPYDGGKTTVLTGGVMLGGTKAHKALLPAAPAAAGWRVACA